MPILVVLEGAHRGAVLRLLPAANRIGRDPAADLVLTDDGVSRLHAEVKAGDDGAFTLGDLGSKNGTWLNGVRLEERHVLAPGDELAIGDCRVVYLDDDGPADGEAHAILATASLAGAAAGAASAARPTARPAPARPRDLLGQSEAIRRVSQVVARCARLATPVLITGESGTGKELVAEALHRLGPRRGGPFVAVNAATLEPALLESELFGHERGAFTGAVARRLGKLELARGGTLFLDELGEMPLAAQAKVLRAVERGEFQRVGGTETLATDARIVAATNRELAALVKDGRFREDLLFRLKVVEIALPPLRDRREDIALLAARFLDELRRKTGSRARAFAPDALRCLERWRFPGNVRELRNLVERCLIFADGETIEVADLPPEVTAFLPPEPAPAGGEALPTLEAVERAHVQRVLAAVAGNKTRAARILGIDRATLYAKVRRLGLEP